MVSNLIFIASEAHSGSTLLELLISGHPQYIGVGEVFRAFKSSTLDQASEIKCSCGNTIDTCPFWKTVIENLKKDINASIPEKYEIFLNSFSVFFGENYIPIDSSKYLPYLKVLKQLPIDLKVIHLIRDVRSWTISQKENIKRNQNSVKSIVARQSLVRFIKWYSSNLKTQNFIQKECLNSFQLGYEEICLYPEEMLSRICDFLGVEFNSNLLKIYNHENHNLLGNRMRFSSEKRQRIFYDHRWMCRNDWLLSSILLPHVMNFNEKNVYQNINNILWHK
ncbi:hypothetical protein PCC7418_2992 [Halothece sp. PCC 7418]|uniref:sulfotransferase n=1 Tax=Halothece sp. (strain PCC 7418) TaxID=65093 RepID=UPI0002A06962|nr:sulfotransferase [Halothece sp. PCC 7418]AFZ45119.1 hypothetical protein PCC7418_2992 [Halothece sp. PCC 7418]